jgi:hypothetical protein
MNHVELGSYVLAGAGMLCAFLALALSPTRFVIIVSSLSLTIACLVFAGMV